MDLSWDIWSNSKKTYLGYIHFSLTVCERGDPIFSCFLRFRKVECNVPSLLTLSPWWPVQKTPFDRKSHLILSYHLQDLSAILLAAIACECWDNLCRAGLNLKGTTLLSQHIVAKSDCFISCSSQDQQWHVFWGQVASVCIIQFMKFIHQNSELPESSPPSRVYIIYIYTMYICIYLYLVMMWTCSILVSLVASDVVKELPGLEGPLLSKKLGWGFSGEMLEGWPFFVNHTSFCNKKTEICWEELALDMEQVMAQARQDWWESFAQPCPYLLPLILFFSSFIVHTVQNLKCLILVLQEVGNDDEMDYIQFQLPTSEARKSTVFNSF